MTLISGLALSFVVGFVVTQVAGVATTIYLHRSKTHRALMLHPLAAWGFRLALWLTTGLITREWVAVHRKHHAFTDEEGDPHSPKLLGFWKVQLGNVFYYAREAKNPQTIERYARDITEDWWDRTVFQHGLLGVGLGTAVLCLAMGLWLGLVGILWGLLAAGVHAVMYVFVFSSSINGLCHAVGYKNFPNTATNIRILGLLVGGEGYHNNHHGHQMSPKFSFKRGEFDPAWPVIRFLVWLGLAKRDRTIEERLASET